MQTHHCEHPLLCQLRDGGYAAYGETALAERREADMPPFSNLAVLRAEAPQSGLCFEFLDAASDAMRESTPTEVHCLGPVPAPMERRAGRYRAQLLLHTTDRGTFARVLPGWLEILEGLPSARRVRWSLDVDPVDLM